MTESTRLRVLARELLAALPRIVGADAGRIDREIRQALAVPGDKALRQVLVADDRLMAWIRVRPGGANEFRAGLPSGYSALAGRGSAAGVSGVTLFVCRTDSCPAPESFVRRSLKQDVPYCSSCNRLLSRAPS